MESQHGLRELAAFAEDKRLAIGDLAHLSGNDKRPGTGSRGFKELSLIRVRSLTPLLRGTKASKTLVFIVFRCNQRGVDDL